MWTARHAGRALVVAAPAIAAAVLLLPILSFATDPPPTASAPAGTRPTAFTPECRRQALDLLAKARGNTATVQEPEKRVTLYSAIGEAFRTAGDTPSVRKVNQDLRAEAPRLSNQERRASTLTYVLRLDQQLGDTNAQRQDRQELKNLLRGMGGDFRVSRRRDAYFHYLAQQERDDGDTVAARATLRLSRACIDNDPPEGDRDGSLLGLVGCQVRIRDFASAWSTISDITDSTFKVVAVLEIGEGQCRAGDRSQAKIAFDEARALVRNLPETKRPDFADSVARALAAIGEIRDARAVIQDIPDPDFRTRAHLKVAETQRRAGDVTGARASLDLAMREADEVETPDVKFTLYLGMAKYVDDPRDTDGYRRFVGRLERAADEQSEAEDKVCAWFEVAAMRTDHGDTPGARMAVERARTAALETTEKTPRALLDLASGLASRGEVKDAEAIVDAIDDPETRARAHFEVAAALITRGDTSAAERHTALAGADGRYLLRELAEAEAKVGAFPDALRNAAAISEPSRQVQAYEEIAEGQVRAGDAAGARKTLQLARAAVDRVKEDEDRQGYCVALARIHVLAGDPAAAKALLKVAGKDWPYEELARAEVRSRHLKETLVWIESEITSPAARAYAYLGAAEGLLPAAPGRQDW